MSNRRRQRKDQNSKRTFSGYRRGAITAIIALVIAMPLVQSPASVATDNLTRFHWNPANPTFHISTSMPSAWRWDAQVGGGRWKPNTEFQPQYGGTTSSTWVGTSIHNVVQREIPTDWREGCPPASSIACTGTYGTEVSAGHYHIEDADIVFNEDFHSYMMTDDGFCQLGFGYDVATISLHEFGHFAGLMHSLNSDSRMWAQYLGCRRYPHQHDIDSMNQNMPH